MQEKKRDKLLNPKPPTCADLRTTDVFIELSVASDDLTSKVRQCGLHIVKQREHADLFLAENAMRPGARSLVWAKCMGRYIATPEHHADHDLFLPVHMYGHVHMYTCSVVNMIISCSFSMALPLWLTKNRHDGHDVV